MSFAQLLRLGAIVFVAVSFVVLGDTAGKTLTSGGVDPFVVAWTRFSIAAVVLLPFSGLQRSEVAHFLDWRLILRSAFVVGGISSILTALRTEPIANVFGAFFIAPIVAYILAVLFLKEQPTRLRFALLIMGFCGVLLVVKPGFGASPGIAFAVLAGVFYGCYLTATRPLAGLFRPRFLLLSQLVIGSVLLAPAAAFVDWPIIDLRVTALLAVSALASAFGNYLLVLANRRAEASVIAPLIYLQLISATLAGVLVFGEWPDVMSLMGLVTIAASGLLSLRAVRIRG